MYQIFLIQIAFQSSDWVQLGDSKNLRRETPNIGDFEYVNISSFAVLGIKLWLKDNDDNRNTPLYSFKFLQSNAQN